MKIQEILNPQPSKYKQIFCGTYGLPVTAIARYSGFSYQHTMNVLNGNAALTDRVEAKFKDLLAELDE